MRTIRFGIWVLPPVLLLTGTCRAKPDKTGVPEVRLLDPGSPPSTERVEAGTPPPVPEVRLLDPGSPPRKPLRFRFTTGTESTLTMTMQVKTKTELGGIAAPPVDLPPVRVSAVFRIREVAPDGSATFEYRMNRPEILEGGSVPAEVAAEVREAMAPFEGLSGRGRMTDRGGMLEPSFHMPEGMPPAMKEVLASFKQPFGGFSAPFPEEPVGVGARWEHTDTIEMMGMQVRQTLVYTLASLDGDRGRLTFEIRDTAATGQLQLPDMPADASVRLDRFEGTGAGELWFRLDQVVPVSGNARRRDRIEVQVGEAGQQEAMAMKMETETTVEVPGQ